MYETTNYIKYYPVQTDDGTASITEYNAIIYEIKKYEYQFTFNRYAGILSWKVTLKFWIETVEFNYKM